MILPFRKRGIPVPFIVLSLTTHLLFGLLAGSSGPLDFRSPVPMQETLNVTLEQYEKASSPPIVKAKENERTTCPKPQYLFDGPAASVNGIAGPRGASSVPLPPAHDESVPRRPEPVPADLATAPNTTANPVEKAEKAPGPAVTNGTVALAVDYDSYVRPVRTAGEFVATSREKLTYRINLLNVPVGNAVLEASNSNGEFRITLKIISNVVISGLYPVDDFVETRMIGGNYLLTRVRQHEGSFRSDFGFTLMLREHKAFWVDRLRNRFDYQTLPYDDAMDPVSGLYFLRKRELEVGRQVPIHLYDSNEPLTAMVDVLRRERLALRGMEQQDTLVVQPHLPTDGAFRMGRDMMIWLTDDENRVPVKVECVTPLGKVTAELVSAEAESVPKPAN